jgi:hypothetical protein
MVATASAIWEMTNLFRINISPPLTTITGLDGAGQRLGLSGHRNSHQWTSSYGTTLKPSFTCRNLIFFPPFNSRSSDMEIFRTLYIFIFVYYSRK